MNARDRLEAAQVRLRRAGEAPTTDDAGEVTAERALFDAAARDAAVEIEICRERWRQWDAVRDGRPLHPLSWLVGPMIAVFVLVEFDPGVSPLIGSMLICVLSVEAWCWVRTNQRAQRLRAAVWPERLSPEESKRP